MGTTSPPIALSELLLLLDELPLALVPESESRAESKVSADSRLICVFGIAPSAISDTASMASFFTATGVTLSPPP